jgi:CheY-like chemotaxis protein
MDEVTLKRAAEPFFTTKESGKGTGLGLSMVYGLAAQSGGLARMSSRLGVGTTVELWLPVCERPDSAQTGHASSRLAPASVPSTVLLVDDDPLVAAAEVAMLEQLGHRVLVAGSGVAALDLVRAEPDIELVITDHAMPGMTGTELASRLGEIRPQLPIVLATGYAEAAASDETGMLCLNKPFRLEDLAALLGAVLKPTRAASASPLDAA